jgi:hypothetical protein
MATIEIRRPDFKEVFADRIYDIFKHAGLPITSDKLVMVRRFTDQLADEISRQTTLDSIKLAKKAAELTDNAFLKAQAAYELLEGRVRELENQTKTNVRSGPIPYDESKSRV